MTFLWTLTYLYRHLFTPNPTKLMVCAHRVPIHCDLKCPHKMQTKQEKGRKRGRWRERERFHQINMSLYLLICTAATKSRISIRVLTVFSFHSSFSSFQFFVSNCFHFGYLFAAVAVVVVVTEIAVPRCKHTLEECRHK